MANPEEFERSTLRLFCMWSLFYDSAISRLLYFDPVYKKAIETLEKFGDKLLCRKSRFLDIACGTGEMIFRLAKKYPHSEFSGADFSKDMLQKALVKTAGVNNIKIIQANVRSLPLPENFFDILLCSDALHHFSEPEQALREISRVTKKGGLFLLLDPAVDSIVSKFIFKIFVEIWDRPKKYYSRKEITKFLNGAGFRIKAIFSYHFTDFFVCYKT